MLLRTYTREPIHYSFCSASDLPSDTQGNLIHFSGVSLHTRFLFNYGHVFTLLHGLFMISIFDVSALCLV